METEEERRARLENDAVHGKQKKQVAGLLRRVVPFSDTVDQDLLHNFQRFVIILEANKKKKKI